MCDCDKGQLIGMGRPVFADISVTPEQLARLEERVMANATPEQDEDLDRCANGCVCSPEEKAASLNDYDFSTDDGAIPSDPGGPNLTRHGSLEQAAVGFCEDLMRGNRVTFKAGYDMGSAVAATREVFPAVEADWLEGAVTARAVNRVRGLFFLVDELNDLDRGVFDRLLAGEIAPGDKPSEPDDWDEDRMAADAVAPDLEAEGRAEWERDGRRD